MQGPYPWPGGSSFTARRLVRAFPPHRRYVEPFAGGAQPFWAKEPAAVEVLGDLNPTVPKMLRAIQKGGLRRCRPTKVSRATFKRTCRPNPSLCDFLACGDTSFDHDRRTYTGQHYEGTTKGQQRIARSAEYQARLRGVKIKHQDFERTMRQYDGLDTFHLLDPPWPSQRGNDYARKNYQGYGDLDPARVKRVVDHTKGKVMILYNNLPEVRRLFCGKRGYHCQTIPTFQTPGGWSGHGRHHTKRLVITKGFSPRIPKR